MKNINIDKCTNLLNLITINNVINDTVVEDNETRDLININELIKTPPNKFFEKIQKKKKSLTMRLFFFKKAHSVVG